MQTRCPIVGVLFFHPNRIGGAVIQVGLCLIESFLTVKVDAETDARMRKGGILCDQFAKQLLRCRGVALVRVGERVVQLDAHGVATSLHRS